ncbi:serine hydrolase domain-containing protein [Deminuibacter soli]|uniref:Class C beta-lactamase-related serine hydrolase n=1 Tax=Deminuibacter soli TaxID=2291815 RepID=A0A3E1NFE4_9BACT|nr:serine hydrolase [Deminuibacter soli]RFM26531.1 class C beta-lactamase-related serine hydrolase [Deminuibacter soli]
MKLRKPLKRILQVLLLLVLVGIGYGIYYCWTSFPIISGYGAKNLCSAIFVAGRDEQQVRDQELHFFPMTLGHFSIDYTDSSVTGTVWGFAKRKAIYRKGLGATLVAGISEKEIRAQQFRLATPPTVNTDTIAWPNGNLLPATVLPAGIDSAQLWQAVNAAFIEKDTLKPARTRAVVVLYQGRLVAEQYAPGFTRNTRLLGWSMTKSITGTLIGMLAKQGKLQVNAPAPVPEWQNPADPRHTITLKNLLQQSSGLQFEEDYSKASDATRMLFGRADMGGFTAGHTLKYAPGSVFYYSSGNSNILSRIIRATVGERDYHAFPYEQLFYKLGMYSAVMEPDASGTFVGSSYMYATARDWARFGLLYYNNGVCNGEQLLPDGWVKEAATPATSALKGQYGYQFWLNAGTGAQHNDRYYPHVPVDMFCADGFEGQNVFIVPSKQLVVVRLGLTQHHNFDADAFLAGVCAAVR